MELIRNVKSMSTAMVVVGGPHVSATKDEILRHTDADLAIKGEGEETLHELIQAIQHSQSAFDEIDGLIWRKNDEIVENKNRAFIQDLDDLPYPDFAAFPLEKYLCYKERTLPMISSRGCPFGCTFCSVRLSMGRGFRGRTPESFVTELQHWHDQGWRRFEINDDCFSANVERAIKICQLIQEKQLKISFDLYNGIRVDRVSPELLRELKQAGCSLVAYGLESANPQVLRNIKKNVALAQVEEAVKWTKEAGLSCSVNFIIGHAGETYTTAKESLDFAKRLPADFVNFYNLVPYPGTEAFEWVEQHGRFLVPQEEYLTRISYRDNRPIFETPEFPVAERMKIMKEGFKLYERKLLQFRLGKTL